MFFHQLLYTSPARMIIPQTLRSRKPITNDGMTLAALGKLENVSLCG
jgi:hypothetical protein